MKKAILGLMALFFVTQALMADCVVKDAQGHWHYFEGLDCTAFGESEATIAHCNAVETAPEQGLMVEAIEVRVEEGISYLYLQVMGKWEKIIQVAKDFVVPTDLSTISYNVNYNP